MVKFVKTQNTQRRKKVILTYSPKTIDAKKFGLQISWFDLQWVSKTTKDKDVGEKTQKK